MTIKEFITATRGAKAVDIDKKFGVQCPDYPMFYLQQVFGVKGTPSTGDGKYTAKNVAKFYANYFKFIEYDMPQIGDIISFESASSPENGHTAIVSKSYDEKTGTYEIQHQWNGSGTIRTRVQKPAKAVKGVSYTITGIARPINSDSDYRNEDESNDFMPKKSNEEIAKEVLAGKWGNGDERKTKLSEAGYDYKTVQAIVNTIVAVTPKKSVVVGAKVKVLKAVQYNGKSFKVWRDWYDVLEIQGDRVVIGVRGEGVTAAINISNIEVI
jgi:hypothetical protein